MVGLFCSVILIICSIICYGVFSVFFYFEEKKIDFSNSFKVQATKFIKMLLLIWIFLNIILILIGIIYLLFKKNEVELLAFFIFECFLFFMLFCSIILYFESRYVYIVVKEDCLIISKLKGKTVIAYTDIKYIVRNPYDKKIITCFDCDGKLLFTINYNFVGSNELNILLNEKCYDELPNSLKYKKK